MTTRAMTAVPGRYRIALLFVTVFALAGFVRCGLIPPSDRVIKEAVIGAYAADLGPNAKAEIDSFVEIVERGPYNQQGQYWPVKIRMYGPKGEIWDCHVSKDDYGKWIVQGSPETPW